MKKDNQILTGKKVAVINLGCKVNKYESDAMTDKLKTAGMIIVEPEQIADVYIVNTCSVTNMAQKKSRQMLRRARKRNPQAVIIAAGCYVNAEHNVLQQEDFLDIVVGNNLKKDIVQVIAQYLKESAGSTYQEKKKDLSGNGNTDYYLDINCTKEYEEMGSIDVSAMDHQRAYIKIQDGCNQFCSYCIIPYTRGRVRSRRPENILKEIEKLAAEGVKEFVLTGIHISSYGLDFQGKQIEYDEMMNQAGDGMKQQGVINNLGELIEAVGQIPAVQRIRLGSLEPRIITREFLQKIGKNDKLCPHFHLSLQSACNDTLKRMNRKYTVEEFDEKCTMLREYFDRPAITTDIIVGFPGETEEEFTTTLQNLKKLELYEIHVFRYSVRSGTVAEKLPGQVSEEIKGQRSDTLLELTAKQRDAYEAGMAGFIDEVLVEEKLVRDVQSEKLVKAIPIGDSGINSPNSTDWEQSQEKLEKKQYFTGHTKRYVKVKIEGNDNMLNQTLKVKIL